MTWDFRGDAFSDHERSADAEVNELRSQVRDLNAICAVLTYLNGRDVGLGSWQTRIPTDKALTIRQQLPDDPTVVMSMDDGALVITVV